MSDFKNLDQLKPYLNTPRDDCEFVSDVAGKPSFFCFNKQKWKQNHLDAPIVFAAVVQANSKLFSPAKNKDLPGVFCFSTGTNKHNPELIRDIANKINAMKSSKDEVPGDCVEMIKLIRTANYFCIKVGASLAGESDIWCATYSIDTQSSLPNMCIPENRVIPFFLMEPPIYNQFVQFKFIPSKYWE